MLAADPARAFYGPGHVRAAAELGAVGTLLLSDSLLRVNDVRQARLLSLAQLLALFILCIAPLVSSKLAMWEGIVSMQLLMELLLRPSGITFYQSPRACLSCRPKAPPY